jgi:chemotaxis protein methyltransferase CheR
VAAQDLTEDEYVAFQRFLEQAAGIVLGDNKHYLVISRLSRVMLENKFANFAELLVRAERDGRFRERVVDEMTTNETSWFRDANPFEILKTTMLPALAKKGARTLRIWSAACSTGQEPYSISMCVQEFMSANPGVLRGEVEIVATDISPSALEEAKAGAYDELALSRGLSAERRARFFQQKEAQWEVRKEIKARVSFRPLNLLQSYSALGKFDLVFCRNVLIYFSPDLKKTMLQRITETMHPGAYLFLGGSESMSNYSDAFQMTRLPNGVIYQLK